MFLIFVVVITKSTTQKVKKLEQILWFHSRRKKGGAFVYWFEAHSIQNNNNSSPAHLRMCCVLQVLREAPPVVDTVLVREEMGQNLLFSSHYLLINYFVVGVSFGGVWTQWLTSQTLHQRPPWAFPDPCEPGLGQPVILFSNLPAGWGSRREMYTQSTQSTCPTRGQRSHSHRRRQVSGKLGPQ